MRKQYSCGPRKHIFCVIHFAVQRTDSILATACFLCGPCRTVIFACERFLRKLSGRPGIPVPYSANGLCGCKATLNLNHCEGVRKLSAANPITVPLNLLWSLPCLTAFTAACRIRSSTLHSITHWRNCYLHDRYHNSCHISRCWHMACTAAYM